MNTLLKPLSASPIDPSPLNPSHNRLGLIANVYRINVGILEQDALTPTCSLNMSISSKQKSLSILLSLSFALTLSLSLALALSFALSKFSLISMCFLSLPFAPAEIGCFGPNPPSSALCGPLLVWQPEGPGVRHSA